jgi:hypothetical protein
MSYMSHLNCFLYHLFLSHLCCIKVLTTDFLVLFCFVFLHKYSNSIMIQLPMSVMSHLKKFIYLIFLSHKHIPRNQTFSFCHISVDTAICHFCQMLTAPSHRHDCPQLLSAAVTVTATATTGTATAVLATTIVNNRSRSPLVRPAASHSTAAVSCHRPQLLCAVAAATAAAVVHNKRRSLSVRPAASNSTAAVRCHRPPLLCAAAAANAAAVVPQPPSTLPPSTVVVRHCCRRCRCRHPNPLYRSAAASATLGISSKIGKAHLLFWGWCILCHSASSSWLHCELLTQPLLGTGPSAPLPS